MFKSGEAETGRLWIRAKLGSRKRRMCKKRAVSWQNDASEPSLQRSNHASSACACPSTRNRAAPYSSEASIFLMELVPMAPA